MFFVFPVDLNMSKNFSVFIFYLPSIGKKYFVTLLLCQDRGSNSAFSSSQYGYLPAHNFQFIELSRSL